MASAAGQGREIEQLKTLLFHSEEERLETLEAEVASLRGYVGGSDRLELATAEVLIGALERAEVDRPRELANVIAPVVVTAIRREVANSRDLMVDALYPITGRLVQAAVANAFKELLGFLEQRINALTSTELWIGRIKSLATGRPISEFVLADGAPVRVNRLLMIERGSGLLVADWTSDKVADNRADLLSAMVSAILEFATQALAGRGELQRLDFGGNQFVLRASPRFILAGECSGTLRSVDDVRINGLFLDAVERMDRGARCDAEMLETLATSVESRPTPGKTQQRSKVVLFVVLIAAILVAGWQLGLGLSHSVVERQTIAALQQVPGPWSAGFPLQLAFDHGAGTVTVSGIEPSDAPLPLLIARLQAAASPYRVINHVGLLSGSDEADALRAEIKRLQDAVASLQGRRAQPAGAAASVPGDAAAMPPAGTAR